MALPLELENSTAIMVNGNWISVTAGCRLEDGLLIDETPHQVRVFRESCIEGWKGPIANTDQRPAVYTPWSES